MTEEATMKHYKNWMKEGAMTAPSADVRAMISEKIGNTYDNTDLVRREAVIIADGAGSLKLAAYRVRNPETKELGKLQFHMTHDNTVMAVMGEEAAKLFTRFVNDTIK